MVVRFAGLGALVQVAVAVDEAEVVVVVVVVATIGAAVMEEELPVREEALPVAMDWLELEEVAGLAGGMPPVARAILDM